MRNITKVAVGVVAALGSFAANAGTVSVSSAAVGVEAATTGALDGVIAPSGLVLTTGTSYLRADRLSISLTNGATFADGNYVLVQSGSNDLTEFTLLTTAPAGESTIQFRASSDLVAGNIFLLSGSTAAGASVAVNLPSLAAGGKVSATAKATDVRDSTDYDTYAASEVFRYFNQFSGAISSTKLGNEIDVESPASRKLFTGGGTSDAVMITFTEASITGTNKVSLNDSDKVDIVLRGDLSGANSITVATGSTARGTATIAADGQSATVSLSASDAYAAGSATLNVLVGSSVLSTSDFTVQADLDFQTETDKNLIAAGTKAGSWTINGLQAKVANVSLNATGFITWLKIANEGAADAVVYADIIYNTYGGSAETKVTNADLGTVAAGTVATISEATILEALGNPTGLVDASLTVTVTGPKNSVFLTAEKKASDGRISVPVFYDNTGGTRKWFQ